MDKNKERHVKRIIGAGIFIITCFILISVSCLITKKSNMYELYNNTQQLKRVVPFLMTIVVFMIGKDGLNQKDSLILKITFVVICLAELSFLFGWFIAGAAFSAICHILLSIRHFSGVRDSFSSGAIIKDLKILVSVAGLILIMIAIFIIFIFYPVLEGNVIFYVMLFYGLILGTSLWMAITNYISGSFPKKNARMIMVGITLYFFSDFLVGLHVISVDEYTKIYVDLAIWILFAPAIVLIALSGYSYKFENIQQQEKQ